MTSLVYGAESGQTSNGSPELLAQGIGLLEKGEIQQALPILKRSVAENPHSEEAHNYYGFALGRTGHLEEAIEEFNEALRLNPRYPTPSITWVLHWT